jgi:hypothetical protein
VSLIFMVSGLAEDEAPKNGEKVIVCREGTGTGYSWQARYDSHLDQFECAMTAMKYPEITHWMKMPEGKIK